jgi:hypothetical protein
MQTKIRLKQTHTGNPFTALCISNANVEPMYRTWGDLAPK